jgi:hypothetical protein
VLDVNLERLRRAHRSNLFRSSLYEGKHAARQVGSVIPPQYFNIGIALGWPAKAIDAMVRRCRIEHFRWPDGDLSSLGMTEMARDNFLRSRINQALTDSALHGVSFLVSTRGEAGEPAALIHVKDALNCTGTWNARRGALDDAFSVTSWHPDDHDRPTGFVLYLDGRTINAEQVDGVWSLDESEHGLGVPVEPLVYRPRPSKPYGASRLTRPMIGLHGQAVRELIRLEGHMDVFSYPEMWMLGADMSAFRNADGSAKAVWQVMLGRIKGLEDNPEKPDNLARPDVKQFPAASPSPHLDAFDALSRAFAREASLPDSAVAIKGLSNPTSEGSYDASQYELIAESECAQDDWETPIGRAVARGLAIQNGLDSVPAEWLSIAPKWLGAKFESRAAKADAGAKQIGAVPWLAETEVGLELLGLSDQQIQRALSERRRAAGRQVIAALGGGAGANGQ